MARDVRDILAEVDHLRDELRDMRNAEFPDGRPPKKGFGRDVEIFTRTKAENRWFAYGYADTDLRSVRQALQRLK